MHNSAADKSCNGFILCIIYREGPKVISCEFGFALYGETPPETVVPFHSHDKQKSSEILIIIMLRWLAPSGFKHVYSVII